MIVVSAIIDLPELFAGLHVKQRDDEKGNGDDE